MKFDGFYCDVCFGKNWNVVIVVCDLYVYIVFVFKYLFFLYDWNEFYIVEFFFLYVDGFFFDIFYFYWLYFIVYEIFEFVDLFGFCLIEVDCMGVIEGGNYILYG